MNIIIYSKSNCPNCTAAKRLLDDKGIGYDEYSADDPNRHSPVKTASGLEIVAMACVTGVVVANVIIAAYFLGSWIVEGIAMLAETVK